VCKLQDTIICISMLADMVILDCDADAVNYQYKWTSVYTAVECGQVCIQPAARPGYKHPVSRLVKGSIDE
jgi:hypothetical protein